MQAPSFRTRNCGQRTRTWAPPQVAARVAQVDRGVSNRFVVTQQMKDAFKRDGFVHLQGVMTEEEMKQHVDPVYNKYLSGEIEVPGKDKDDASVEAAMAPHRDLSDVTLVSIMLPRKYSPQWQGNLLEQKAEDIACQLLGTNEVDLDFDQILAKKPRTRASGMPWHQDAAAWPPELNGADCATANMWVAVSDVPVDSGCLRYIPGTHLEGPLRPHEPVGPDENHMMKANVSGERAVLVPMKRGDIVVHSERVVHGSGPNMTEQWRCGYILNFKRATCIVQEREWGASQASSDASNPYTKKAKN